MCPLILVSTGHSIVQSQAYVELLTTVGKQHIRSDCPHFTLDRAQASMSRFPAWTLSRNGLRDIFILVSSRVASELGKDIHGFHEVGSDLVDLH